MAPTAPLPYAAAEEWGVAQVCPTLLWQNRELLSTSRICSRSAWVSAFGGVGGASCRGTDGTARAPPGPRACSTSHALWTGSAGGDRRHPAVQHCVAASPTCSPSGCELEGDGHQAAQTEVVSSGLAQLLPDELTTWIEGVRLGAERAERRRDRSAAAGRSRGAGGGPHRRWHE